MSQLVFLNWGLQMRVTGLQKSIFNISLVGTFLGGVVCFWLGNVKNLLENVLLAGEMLRSEKTNF